MSDTRTSNPCEGCPDAASFCLQECGRRTSDDPAFVAAVQSPKLSVCDRCESLGAERTLELVRALVNDPEPEPTQEMPTEPGWWLYWREGLSGWTPYLVDRLPNGTLEFVVGGRCVHPSYFEGGWWTPFTMPPLPVG